MACFRSCVKCLSLVPWASLIAMLVCWAGTALFCGTAHEGITLFLNLMINSSTPGFSTDTSLLDDRAQAFKYAIYGIAPFMFVVSILFLLDGILATRAVKKEIEFTCRTNKCGICSGVFHTAVAYILSLGWLLMSAASALPVHFFLVANSQCDIVEGNSTAGACIDFVQTGLMPYDEMASSDYGRLCGSSLKKMCDTNEYTLTYQMFVIAFAGSCVTLISLIHYLMSLSANFAYIKMARKLTDYQNTKFREEMELHDIINTARSNERLTPKY